MREDHRLLAFFVLCFVVIITAVTVALNRSAVIPTVPLDELPVAAPVNAVVPTAEACQAAGGAVAYERGSECVSIPSVTDACDWGIPCFFLRNEPNCREVRRMYCSCTKASQCPSGYVCNTYGREGRCESIPSYPYAPKPIR